MATKKYLSLERLTEYDELIKSEIESGDASVKSYVDTELAKKASSSHSHAISEVTNLQTKLDEKATQANLAAHTGDSTIHVTSGNKTNWNSAYTHSTSAHAPSNAEKNIIIGIQKNGTDLTVNSSTRKVNIIVPTTAADIGASPSTHKHDNDYDAKGAADTALASAKSYADEKVANLLDNSTDAVDSIMELAEAMKNNADAIDALEDVAASKVPTSRKINGKALSSDITLSASDVGADASGSASAVQTNLDTHTSNTTVHITSTERTNWNAAKTHADSAHAPSNAEKNQNAFSNIKVGTTTVAADTTTDTLELVGSNVTITPDATNDKITIAVATGSTSAAGILKLTNSTSSTSTTTAATPSSVKSAYDLANTANQAAAAAQSTADGKANATHSHTVSEITDLTATATELNYMDGVTSGVQAQLDAKAAQSALNSHTSNTDIHFTAAERTKLAGIATGANKTTVDSALSSTSTNPVQNKAVNSAITTLTSTVSTNTSSISSNTTAITNLQTAIGEFEEITSEEITALFR